MRFAIRNILRTAATSFAVLLAASASHATAADVLIAHATYDPSFEADVQAKIIATGLITGAVDLFDVAAATPTLAQLQAYHAVLVFTDTPGAFDPDALGDVLADYVDAGGGVVQAVFAFWSSGLNIGGRWTTGDYSVWEEGAQSDGTPLTIGTVYDPGHPLLAGVAGLNGGSSSYHNTVGALQSGAVAVADWSNGQPLVGYNTSAFAGRIVGLNFYPPSSDARSDFWDASTDGAVLMANALNFAAIPEVSTLTLLACPAALVGLGLFRRRRAA